MERSNRPHRSNFQSCNWFMECDVWFHFAGGFEFAMQKQEKSFNPKAIPHKYACNIVEIHWIVISLIYNILSTIHITSSD